MDDLEALAEKIKALSRPDQLRLAADLLERQRDGIAYTIVDRVAKELGAARLLRGNRDG